MTNKVTREFLREVKELGEINVNGVFYKYKAYLGWGEVRKRVGAYWSLIAKYDEVSDEWKMVA